MKNYELKEGDCLEVLKDLDENSVDSVVTDPPYGLAFMGKKWDKFKDSKEYQEFSERWSREVLRVLKPGGYMLCFGGTRTYHRMVCGIEDAGFEIRDTVAWLYGSGFPKSLNLGKAYDKMMGNEREVYNPGGRYNSSFQEGNSPFVSLTATKTGKRESILPSKGKSQYEGWGTSLKPAFEPIIMARKPLSEKSVVENVMKYGTGGINIDDCRVPYGGGVDEENHKRGVVSRIKSGGKGKGWKNSSDLSGANPASDEGRFPANVIHDGSKEVVRLFPDSDGAGGSLPNTKVTGYGDKVDYKGGVRVPFESGSGSAARFFYCVKASKLDREEGLFGVEKRRVGSISGKAGKVMSLGGQSLLGKHKEMLTKDNFHPTVKPMKLMAYLCRLVTPKSGVVLDPFAGSGSTGKAALLLGFSFIGIEGNKDYIEICKKRLDYADKQGKLFG